VGWWSDLLVTMGTRRADRIDAAEAERLLAGRPTVAAWTGLAALLSEAAGPARPDELAGEPAAVARFRTVRSGVPSTTPSTVDTRRRRWYAASPARTAALRLGLVVLLLAAAGTLTVTLAYRPARMQPPADVSSTPSPSPSSPDAGEGRGGRPSRGASPSGAPGSGPAASQTTDLAAVRLCRVWTDGRQDKATRDQAAEQLGRLIGASGRPNGIPAFCRKVLDSSSTGSGTATTAMRSKKAKNGE
jgi:hypothetical protein